MLYIVRHGERADLNGTEEDKKNIRLKFDPNLTENGKLQAQTTGKFIDLNLESTYSKKGIKYNVIIISSPFLRCLQTAANIAKNLKNVQQKTIFIEDKIGEIMSSRWFEYNVNPDLYIRS